MLGLLRVRVGLQRQQLAVGPDDLVFVEVARAQPRHEQFPEAAGMQPAHRHAPAVPVVEIPDQADPLRVRRPHREPNSLDALMHRRVRAELLKTGVVVALDQQMDVELAEHRRETVDVVELANMPAIGRAQPIAERLLAVRNRGCEEPIGMQPLTARRDLAGCGVDHRHQLGAGQHRSRVQPGRALVHPEKAERIAVPPLDDGLDLSVMAI